MPPHRPWRPAATERRLSLLGILMSPDKTFCPVSYITSRSRAKKFPPDVAP